MLFSGHNFLDHLLSNNFLFAPVDRIEWDDLSSRAVKVVESSFVTVEPNSYDFRRYFGIGPDLSLLIDFGRLAAGGSLVALTAYSFNGISYALFKRNTKRETCPITAGFYSIIAVNCFVFLMWQSDTFKDVLNHYFVLSTQSNNLNVVNLIGATVSHNDIMHLFKNMATLHGAINVWKMGNHSNCTMMRSCHGGEFISFYITSSIVSSLCSLAIKILLKSNISSVGSSGAICGLIAYQLTVVPPRPLPIQFHFLNRPLLTSDFLKIFVLTDLLGLMQMALKLDIMEDCDFAAHLGGYAFGAWYGKGGGALMLKTGKTVANALEKFADSVSKTLKTTRNLCNSVGKKFVM